MPETEKVLPADESLVRCTWVGSDPRMVAYHDEEWGVPQHDDGVLLEYLILDGAQAGLSWSTILNKREGYRRAFADYDPHRISQFDDAKIADLLQDSSIVRNRQKVQSAVRNAGAFLDIQREFGSFDRFLWGLLGDKTLQNSWQVDSEIPAETPDSQLLSKELRARGFSFVGPTICYAFMQAAGLVNDHLVSCFRYRQLA